MAFGTLYKPVYSGSGDGHIDCRVDVGMLAERARLTVKLCLIAAVGLLAVSALRASPAGVSRIDRDQRDTVELGLVFEKRSELTERPTAHPGTLLAPEPSPSANSSQVLDCDSASGAFGIGNDLFADYVILMPLEPGLTIAESPHGPASVPASPAFETVVHPLAHRPTNAMVLASHLLDRLSADSLSVAGSGDVGDSKIDPKEFMNFNRRVFCQINGAVKVELPVAVNKVTLALDAVETLALVFAVNHRDNLTAGERQQADLVDALEAHQALIVGHRPCRPELRALRLVPLKAFDRLADGPNRHLTRQSEPLAKVVVTATVNARLREYRGVETDLGRERGGLIEPLHRVEHEAFLFAVRQQAQLERKLHAYIIWTNSIHSKGRPSSAA